MTPKRITIPSCWSATEALQIAAFLEHLLQQIWNAHGSAMTDQLDRIRHLQFASRNVAAMDDDIPF